MKQIIFFFFLLFIGFTTHAQSEGFVGSWQMEYQPTGSKTPIRLQVQISYPEKNILYPTEIKLQYDSFSAVYHVLLVKRSVRQLAIGRNKIPSEEKPFSLGNWPIFLNGILDFSRDLKGNYFLTHERLPAKDYMVKMPLVTGFDPSYQQQASVLMNFLKDAEIKLKKISNETFVNAYTDTILRPHLSADYYGIMDTINVSDRNGVFSFSGNKKTENGVVSVIVNGGMVIDQNDLSVNKPLEDFKIDTGLNIIVFYADNYGRSVNTTGKLNVAFGNRKYDLDFSDKDNIASTFIVSKVYYSPELEMHNNSTYQSNQVLLSEADLQRDIKIFHYPDLSGRNLLKNDTAKALAEKTLLRESKSVGSIKAESRDIVMALWDDALEDGDSISLNINGHWIVQAFPVKKKPQFISVRLDGGQNKIVFIADNLGSVSPNTAILEIIDGSQRRSFMIDTNLSQNNLINIMYNVKADK